MSPPLPLLRPPPPFPPSPPPPPPLSPSSSSSFVFLPPPPFLLLLGSPTAPGETVQEGPDADAAAGSCRSRGGAAGEGPAADGQPRCGVAEGAGGLGDAEGAPISRVWQLEQELAEERRQRQLTADKLAAALEQLAAALEAAAAAGSAAGWPSAEDDVLVLPTLRAAAPRSNAAVGGGAPAAASGGPRTLALGCLLEAAPDVSRQVLHKQAGASGSTQQTRTQHKPDHNTNG